MRFLTITAFITALVLCHQTAFAEPVKFNKPSINAEIPQEHLEVFKNVNTILLVEYGRIAGGTVDLDHIDKGSGNGDRQYSKVFRNQVFNILAVLKSNVPFRDTIRFPSSKEEEVISYVNGEKYLMLLNMEPAKSVNFKHGRTIIDNQGIQIIPVSDTFVEALEMSYAKESSKSIKYGEPSVRLGISREHLKLFNDANVILLARYKGELKSVNEADSFPVRKGVFEDIKNFLSKQLDTKEERKVRRHKVLGFKNLAVLKSDYPPRKSIQVRASENYDAHKEFLQKEENYLILAHSSDNWRISMSNERLQIIPVSDDFIEALYGKSIEELSQ